MLPQMIGPAREQHMRAMRMLDHRHQHGGGAEHLAVLRLQPVFRIGVQRMIAIGRIAAQHHFHGGRLAIDMVEDQFTVILHPAFFPAPTSSAGMKGKNSPADQTPNHLRPSTSSSVPSSTRS